MRPDTLVLDSKEMLDRFYENTSKMRSVNYEIEEVVERVVETLSFIGWDLDEELAISCLRVAAEEYSHDIVEGNDEQRERDQVILTGAIVKLGGDFVNYAMRNKLYDQNGEIEYVTLGVNDESGTILLRRKDLCNMNSK